MRRRVMLLTLAVLVVGSMFVSPALADDRDRDCWDEDWAFWVCDKDRDKDRDNNNGRVHDKDDNDVEVCCVPVLVPWGFWHFDWWWGWFWVDWGSYWDCLD